LYLSRWKEKKEKNRRALEGLRRSETKQCVLFTVFIKVGRWTTSTIRRRNMYIPRGRESGIPLKRRALWAGRK